MSEGALRGKLIVTTSKFLNADEAGWVQDKAQKALGRPDIDVVVIVGASSAVLVPAGAS